MQCLIILLRDPRQDLWCQITITASIFFDHLDFSKDRLGHLLGSCYREGDGEVIISARR